MRDRLRKIKLTIEMREAATAYTFLIPWLIGFGLFVCYPLGYSLYISFHEVRVSGMGVKYIPLGWQNYTNAFLKDNTFAFDLFNYFKQTLITIPMIVIFALFVALMLNIRFPGRMLFRTVFFLPVIFATGQVLTELFDQNAGGLSILDQYDITGFIQQNLPKTLAEPILEVLQTFIIILWFSGVQVLIYIAGMQTIGKSVYEAARIDGASPWEVMWKITLPGTAPFIVLNLMYTIVDMFTFPLSPILKYINLGSNFGYTAAIGWIYFTFVFLLIVVTLAIANRFSIRQNK